jgi:glycosyltransferase involved in cell wall biosynthesis
VNRNVDQERIMSDTCPAVSLVVCTLARQAQLRRLFDSLSGQTDPDFEVVLVDQNPPGMLDPLVAEFSGRLTLHHLRSAKGLSRARNVGVRYARAAIVGFPDDDCWYDSTVVAQVTRAFGCDGPDVLTGRTLDADGTESVSGFRPQSGPIDRDNVFSSGNSSTLFARRTVIDMVGGFDERLGVGAATPFQSGEETDLLLRCLALGRSAFFDRDFIVRHEQTVEQPEAKIARVRAYSVGFGRLMRVHRYGMVYLGNRVARSLVRGGLRLITGDASGARQSFSWAVGTCQGYLMANHTRALD